MHICAVLACEDDSAAVLRGAGLPRQQAPTCGVPAEAPGRHLAQLPSTGCPGELSFSYFLRRSSTALQQSRQRHAKHLMQVISLCGLRALHTLFEAATLDAVAVR